MELKTCRVQNYKKIQDTGWIDCDRLTVFVGKNEAGKSALFRGLSKLKSTDEAKYDPIKEFPHGRYTSEFETQDWPVASGRYELSAQDRKSLSEISTVFNAVECVEVTKYYSNMWSVDFEPELKIPELTVKQWHGTLSEIKRQIDDATAPNGQGENWKNIKACLTNYLQSQVGKIDASGFSLSEEHINAVRTKLTSNMNEQWVKEIIGPCLEKIDEGLQIIVAKKKIEEGKEWVYSHIPYFLYFGNYEVLNSAIYLPEFINRINGGHTDSKTRVQSALFKHVGVDIKQLASLGSHQQGQGGENANVRKQIDELDIKANSASISMTKKFSDWWEQRRHKFSYKFHGDYFRIWVSDDLDPADVELEERSLGLQYFFSFYLLFLVEAEERHRDCILLLDEPGIHLHGTAQRKLVTFLENLSEKNQTFYTTHSPFMIKGESLYRARAVYETPEGTLVSSDVWPKDKDTLFPLQAALGYSVCQSLFISRKQVMVEGPTDYSLLYALNQRLKAQGKGLDDDIILIPMGGTSNLAPLASMLIGHDIEIAILLDSDPAGIGSIKKIRKHLADIDERCVLVSQVTGNPSINELEDLVPEQYYLDAVCRAYPDVKLTFTKEEGEITPVVDRINSFFEKNPWEN